MKRAAPLLPVLLAALLTALAACGRTLPTIPIQIGGVQFRVEVARSEEEKARGLMFRRSLGERAGMIFVYDADEHLSFWMKNTKIPLSIAYADGSGRIVRILDMEPGFGKPDASLVYYESERPAKYALEMRMGWFRDKGIREGDVMRFDPAILAARPR